MTAAPRPGVMEIAPYTPGRSEAPGATRIFKLSSNESPFGPSPKAVAAFSFAAGAGVPVLRAPDAAALLAFGAVVGFIGSYLAVARFLRT